MCSVNFWTREDVCTVGRTYSQLPICVGLTHARPKQIRISVKHSTSSMVGDDYSLATFSIIVTAPMRMASLIITHHRAIVVYHVGIDSQ